MNEEISRRLAEAAARVKPAPDRPENTGYLAIKTAPQDRRRHARPTGRSGKKGVQWRPDYSQRRPFIAIIMVDRKHQVLGAFATPEEAGRAYDRAARGRWGEDCFLNYPEDR